MATVRQGGRQMSVPTMTARILRGEENLAEWDDREIERGQRRRADGTFPKSQPTVVPVEIHNELVRRRMKKAIYLLQRSTPRAVRVLMQIIDDPEAANRDRIKAAELVLDRTLGKAVQPVDVNLLLDGEKPWQRMMADAIVSTENQALALPAGEIVDAEGDWLPHGPVADDWELDDTEPDEDEMEVVEGELVDEDEDEEEEERPKPRDVSEAPRVVRPKWST